MGWMYAHNIEKAADHLLKLLLAEGKVPYERFYDGGDAEEELAEATGLYPDEAAVTMDEAAAELAHQGYVKLIWLDTKLADGEPAYEIELLSQGRAKLMAGIRPKFRDLDL